VTATTATDRVPTATETRSKPTATTATTAFFKDAVAGSRSWSRLALTATEAAEALGVSPDFFHKHIDLELRWVRRGRKKLVAVAELERWLEREAARTLE
jgi:excisionase family DNA binding protein